MVLLGIIDKSRCDLELSVTDELTHSQTDPKYRKASLIKTASIQIERIIRKE